MSYEIKNLAVLNVAPTLIVITDIVALRYGLNIITSAYRPGDLGVHGTTPLRGVDLRCADHVYGNRIQAEINVEWIYDTSRPEMKVAKFHDCGFGLHLHLQVCNNTRKRKSVPANATTMQVCRHDEATAT